jgi:hypothetical protein
LLCPVQQDRCPGMDGRVYVAVLLGPTGP